MAPRAAEHAPFPEGVDGRLRQVLAARGIDQLYTHQAAAVEHALAGRNVVITTPTASGKTLCYNAPVLSAILTDPSARALYLFPTKALAQDQLAELHELSDQLSRLAELEIGVFTYDGDTPQDARRAIRGRAHVVLSNPDMVHSGILPHHPRWAKLFENLRYVVIDELHAYRGVFGSHLCNVLRRLRRICRHYGSNPTFICSSATIANPKELAEALVEQPFELVSESGAPRGEKFFVFVNPPVVNHQLGIRRSYLAETRRIASEFLKRQLQLIVFAQSRLTTEILTTYLKDDFGGQPGTPDQIRGYRGGYLPQRRREIEKGVARRQRARRRLDQRARARHRHRRARRLRDGGLSGHDCRHVAARGTRGPPKRTIGGGAGREQRAARSVRRPEPVVFLRRVAGARAHRSRQPAHPGRSRQVRGVRAAVHDVRAVREARTCRRCSASSRRAASCTGPENPAAKTARGSGPTSRIRPTPSACDRSRRTTSWSSTRRAAPTSSARRASTSGPPTLHEKAIYIIEGALYQVEKLDFEGRKAYVRQIDCDYYTDAITYTKVTVLDTFAGSDRGIGDRGSRSRIPLENARRSACLVARRRVQEDQVLHERERRVGRARSARAADAHDGVLADGAEDR